MTLGHDAARDRGGMRDRGAAWDHGAARDRGAARDHGAARDRDAAVPAVPPADVYALLDELDRVERAVESGLPPTAALQRARRLALELAAGPGAPAPQPARRLVPAVRAELDRAVRTLGARGGVVTMGTERVLDPAVAHRVLEVVRSVLDNIVRHSGATTLRVGLVFDPGTVRLLVEDDGCGFDPAAVVHAGLAGAADGVRHLGGEFEIDSTPGWGTRIRTRLPEPPIAPALTGLTAAEPTAAGSTAAEPSAAESTAGEATAAGPTAAGSTAAGSAAAELTAAEPPAGRMPVDEPAPGRPAAPVPPRPDVRRNAALTLREREVRELVEQGLADKQIAGLLRISVKTVEKHVSAILRKTGARNRTMLARFGSAGYAERS
ncbi:LuxR C-terminal-related transcriptional regulator [Pseudonocardia parietis]|uniref:DNA-binding CsgD family transcriptional regulator n=1 Tax=Pseudonocardia parietis TaxID=570936 RepID=A0ABS4VTQ6_9PSEU|nr:LuxR C-terminal-related transcriptional regulator [Pseudonocardia parietis]MBP2367166.1 DNA-binding CsgD family transcriptional regulator [Pseudonocardia parietis]